MRRLFAGASAAILLCGSLPAEDRVLADGSTFAARDTLDCGGEANADAAACLDGLKWEGAAFTVKCRPALEGCGDWLMRFPTPHPSGNALNDRVAMEWYGARGETGRLVRAPAVVIVHESGRGMVGGRIFARGLQAQGLHTFLIHLPGYGARTSEFSGDVKKMLPGFRQAIADVRRARDAVAALPFIDPARIAVSGISLGGFITAAVAGLDRGFDQSFILLAGGNLAEVLLHGERDAAAIHRQLTAAGLTDEKIRELAQVVEPLRLAHRVDAGRTWLFSGTMDEVVPPACSLAFAKAAQLDAAHHIKMPVTHYTAALLLPTLLTNIGALLHGRPMPAPASP